MNKVVLISGGITTKGLTPHLLKAGFDVAILDPQTAETQAQLYGERVIPILKFVQQPHQNFAYNEAVKLSSRVFANGVKEIADQIEEMPEWYSFGKNGLGDNLATWLPGFTHTSFTNQIIRLQALDGLAQNRQVTMCITHEDVTELFGGLARWAHARGIPTMHIPHANPYLLPSSSPDVHETSICDYLAATPFMEQFYKRNGYKGQIKLTGSPLFDRWAAYRPDKAWSSRALKLDTNKPIVVYMSSWGQMTNAHDDQTCFETTLREIMLAGFDQLIIKLHPGEQPNIEQNYAHMAQDLGCRCIITRLYLEPILSCADLAITLGASNVTVDAACMNVPSVVVNLPGYSIQHPAIPECEPSELETVANEQLQASTKFMGLRDDFLHQMRYSDHATENIAQWVIELAK